MKSAKLLFEKLKKLCSNTPILVYADYTKPFYLHTDARGLGLGTVLYQKQEEGPGRVVAFNSHTLSKPGNRCDACKLEFLALKWSITD